MTKWGLIRGGTVGRLKNEHEIVISGGRGVRPITLKYMNETLYAEPYSRFYLHDGQGISNSLDRVLTKSRSMSNGSMST